MLYTQMLMLKIQGHNWDSLLNLQCIVIIYMISKLLSQGESPLILERFSKNRQEEENTITFRLKCIVIA